MVRPVQPSPQHVWVPWKQIPKEIRRTIIPPISAPGTTLRGPLPKTANVPEGLWLLPGQMTGAIPIDINQIQPQLNLPQQQPAQPPAQRNIGQYPQQPAQFPAAPQIPNLMDQPIQPIQQAPLQPGQFTAQEQRALNQRPGLMTRQQILQEITRNLPPRGPGENYQQYADRLNEQIRNNPFMQELFQRQQAGGVIRGDELFDILNPLYAQTGPRGRGELDRILEEANRANRPLNANEQQRINELYNQLTNALNSGVGSQADRGVLQERLNAFRRDYENHQRMHPNANFLPLAGQQQTQPAEQGVAPAQAQQAQVNPLQTRAGVIQELMNRIPRNPGESNNNYLNRLNNAIRDIGLFNRMPANEQGPIAAAEIGGGDGGEQPPGAQAEVNPRAAFLVDRMNGLLGQIRRANRRATQTEMGQISDLYGDVQQQLGGNVPANLQAPLERIRRDFNAQAILLNIPGLGEAGTLPQQTQAQQLGVPVDINGNVDMNAYQRQFPHFFNQAGGLINERQAERAVNNLPRAQRANQMDYFRKIRSDINQVRWARNQGEVGYETRPGEGRAAEMARIQREDAAFRASNEYRNTTLPGGVVAETAEQQAPSPAPEEIRGRGRARTMTPPPIERRGRAETMISGAQPATTTERRPGQPAATGEARAVGEAAPERRRTAKDIFLGAKPTEQQIPIYTRDQLNAMNELRGMGMELLRQSYQPLTPDVQQQFQASTAMQSILNRLQNNDPIGAQQELALAGGAANVIQAANLPGLPGLQAMQQQIPQGQMGLPTSQYPIGNIPLPASAYQPGSQGFVAPGLQPGQQQRGLAGLANIAANVGQAYQQAGGGLRGVLNAIQQGAQGVAQGANVAGQAAALPGQVQQAYRQQGGGLRGGLAALQQGAQGIANLGQQRPGWEYGPGYGMQYPHPLPWTAANELTRFYEQTVPTLAERFTAAGGGQRSAAFQGALGGAGRGLGLGLAALGEQQQQQNLQNQLYAQQQAFNQMQAQREFAENQRRYGQQMQLGQQAFQANLGGNLAQYGLQPQVQPAINPGGGGLLAPLIGGIGQAVRGGVQAAML